MGARVDRYHQLGAGGGPQGGVHQLAYVGPGWSWWAMTSPALS